MRYMVLLLLLSGCLVVPQPQQETTPSNPIEITNPTPTPFEYGGVLIDAPGSLVGALHKWLGSGNTLTLKDAVVIDQPTMKIALAAGTSFTYTFSDQAGSLVFNDPKPKVEARVFGMRIHPTLTRVDLKADDTGIATATYGPKTVRESFDLRWVRGSQTGVELEEALVEKAPEKPILWVWADAETCLPCQYFEADVKDAKDLPFVIVRNPKGVPNPFDSIPAFAWHQTEIEPSKVVKQNFTLRGYAKGTGLVHIVSEFKRTRSKKVSMLSSDWHSHQCGSCRTIWSHSTATATRESHRCPRCGRFQFDVM